MSQLSIPPPLDPPAPAQQQTRIIVTDARVIAIGHASNRAACVAVSAAMQTFAYVVGQLGMLAGPVDSDLSVPRYSVTLEASSDARKAISGLMASFAGIARTCPGALLVSDNRIDRDAFDVKDAVLAESSPETSRSSLLRVDRSVDGRRIKIIS